jgi:5-methylcytosine-specific restriction endonuclease McrA
MLTMNWKDLQYRKPKAIKKKVKKNKDSQLVSVKYPLSRTSFSASNWEEYQQWIKQQKLQEKAQNRSKPKKGKTTKTNGEKALKTSKKQLTRKELYQEELKDKRWREKSLQIMKRDNFKCALCGSKHNLQVHHIKYIDGKKAWEHPTSVLITLCDDCHNKVHSNKNHELNPYRKI